MTLTGIAKSSDKAVNHSLGVPFRHGNGLSAQRLWSFVFSRAGGYRRPVAIPEGIRTMVVSYGGVGTSFLMRHLEKYTRINDPSDRDGLKHTPIPPLLFGRDFKCIYVVGDPVLAVASLFRRGFAPYQVRKLRRWIGNEGQTSVDGGIEEYAARGADVFGMEQHFRNWHDRYRLYPTLFVKYEAIWDNVGMIRDFLDLPGEFEATFPPRLERSSSTDRMPVHVLENLQRIYGDLTERVADLPNLEVVQPGRAQHRLRAHVELALLILREMTAYYHGRVKRAVARKRSMSREV